MSNGKRSMAICLLRTAAMASYSAVALLVATRAQAQTQELTWDSPQGCPQREEVLAKVREIAGDEVFAKTTLSASGSIRQVNGAYRLELDVVGEAGAHVRTIDAKVCGDLLGAAAVVLGLNLRRLAGADETDPNDPAAVDESGGVSANGASNPGGQGSDQPSGSPANQTAPTTTTTTSKPVTTSPTAPGTPRLVDEPRVDSRSEPNNMWVLVPQVQVSVGSLPEPSVQWGAGVGFRTPDWLVSLSGRYQPPQTVQSKTVSGVGFSVTRAAAEIGLARGFRGDHFEWAPGVLLGAEYLMVQGSGEDIESSRGTTQYAFVGLGVSLRWFATSWLSFAANLSGEVPLSRPRLTVGQLGEVSRMGPANVRLALGSEWNF